MWVGIAAILVVGSGFMGYVTQPKNTSHPLSPSPVSTQQVISDIQNQQLQQNKVAEHIRMIHMEHTEGEGFAFASFDVDGNPLYASLLLSTKGYDMSAFAVRTGKTMPIQYVTLRGCGG